MSTKSTNREDKYSYLSNDLSEEEIEKIKSGLEELEEFSMLPISDNVSMYIANPEGSPDFLRELKKDIEKSSNFLIDCIYIIENNEVKNSPISKIRNDLVVKIEGKDIVLPYGAKDLKAKLKESLLENIYEVFNKEGLLEGVEEIKDEKSFISILKIAGRKSEYQSDLHELLGEAPVNYFRDLMVKIFSKYYKLEIEQENKSKRKKLIDNIAINNEVATILVDAQHTLIFPLSEADEKEFKEKEFKEKEANRKKGKVLAGLIGKFEKIFELNEIMKNPKYNKFISKLEVDLVSKNDMGKIKQLEKHIEVIKTMSEYDLALTRSHILRYRKLGKHKANGMFIDRDSSEGLEPIVAIDPAVKSPSEIHEYAHLMTKEIDQDIRNYMVSYFREKMNLSEYKDSKQKYYNMSEEIIARLAEIGHDLVYPESDEVKRLCKKREEYEARPEYFDYKNMSEKEKEMVVDFYKVFFENKSGIKKEELKLKFQDRIEEKRKEPQPKPKNEGDIFDKLRREENVLKKILRDYSPEVVSFLIEEVKQKEANCENLIFKEEELLKYLFRLLSMGQLNRFNNKKSLSVREDYPAMIKENNEIFNLLISSINGLSPEKKVGFLELGGIGYNLKKLIDSNTLKGRTGTNILKIKSIASEAVSNFQDYEKKAEYGIFSLLTEESILEIMKEDGEVLFEKLNIQLNNKIKKEELKKEEELILNYLNQEKGIEVKVTKGDLLEYVLRASQSKTSIIKKIRASNTGLYDLVRASNDYDRNGGKDKRERVEEILEEVLETFDFEKRMKAKNLIPLSTFMEDIDINILKSISSEQIIEASNSVKSKDKDEYIANILNNKFPVEVKSMKGFSKLPIEIRDKVNRKLEYLIKKVIPAVEKRKNFFIEKDFADGLISNVGDYKMDISELPRARAILEIVQDLYLEIEYLEGIKENSVEGYMGIFDENDGYVELKAKDIEKISKKKEEVIKDIERGSKDRKINESTIERLKLEFLEGFEKKEEEEKRLLEMVESKNIDGIIDWYTQEVNSLLSKLGTKLTPLKEVTEKRETKIQLKPC